MNSHFTYFIILSVALAGPFLLSFDKKVAFYKQWKCLFPAMIIPAIIYILWDIYFTSLHVWSFNSAYVSGIELVNLPLEEVLFFFVVPYCCVFIYACVRKYFPEIKKIKQADVILKLLAIILFITGILFYYKSYTSCTFLLLSVCIATIYVFPKFFASFDTASFLVAYLIILIPFLVINGVLTAIPVVLYNNEENLGIRIFTIPIEDIFYGMLLILLNVLGYEKLQSKTDF